MSTELAKPESFQDIVREQVRTVIMKAVPDEQIDKLIQKEYEAFFDKRGYNKNEPSAFSAMVNNEINKFLLGKVQEYVEGLMTKEWDETGQGQKVMEKVVKELAPIAMQSISENIVTVALNNFRNALNQQRY